jgi:hypothetical protein
MSSALVHLPARALGAAEIPSVVRNLKPACASLAFPPTRQLLAAQLFRRTEAFLLEQGP